VLEVNTPRLPAEEVALSVSARRRVKRVRYQEFGWLWSYNFNASDDQLSISSMAWEAVKVSNMTNGWQASLSQRLLERTSLE